MPFLGSSAPQNFPVTFALRSVGIGGERLDLWEEPEVERNADCIRLSRGDVTSVYRCELDQVEQSFEFQASAEELHALGGDLVLDIAVETSLQAAEEGDGSLVYRGACGGVSIGRAFLLDEVGGRFDVRTEAVEGGVRLTVPRETLERAQGTILIDPLVATVSVDNFASAELTRPDVAHEFDEDRYCVVYLEQFSAGDSDVYATYIDGTTMAFEAANYVDLRPVTSSAPAVASNRASGTFGVVVQHSSPAGPSLDIHLIDAASNGSMPLRVTVDAPVSTFSMWHDVGGDSWQTTPTGYCVAFARTGSSPQNVIQVEVVDGATGTSLGDASFISGPNESWITPKLSKSVGDPGLNGAWNLTWQEVGSTGSNTSVHAAQINYDGAVTTPRFTVQSWPASMATSLQLDVSDSLLTLGPNSGSGLYTVVVTRTEPSGASHVEAFMCTAGTVVSSVNVGRARNLSASLPVDLSVSSTSTEWFVSMLERSGASVELQTAILQPVAGDIGITERTIVSDSFSSLGDAPTRISSGSVFAGHGTGNWRDMLLVFDKKEPSRNIFASRMYAEPVGLAGHQVCSGTPNSTGIPGFLTATGNRNTTGTKWLRGQDLPPGMFGMLANSPALGPPVQPPGSSGLLCLTGSVGRDLTSVTSINGSGEFQFLLDPTSIAQPSGPVAALSGQSWTFQLWHRDLPSGGGASNFTNAVVIRFE